MSMESKQDFLRSVELALSDAVTVSDMDRIMRIMADVLENYEMQSTAGQVEHDDCLECYLAALSVECKSQKTIDRYRYVISRLMAYVKVPTRKVTIYHLRGYLASEKQRGISDRTLEGCRQIFSAYFNWLQRESLIDRNPAVNLGTVKYAKLEKKAYSAIDMDTLYSHCESVRDRAILSFLASTGCRISEVTGLNRDAVDLTKLECIVRGKGNKERTVYLSQVAGMHLQKYLQERTDDSEALFVNRNGARFLPGGIRLMLKRLAERAGVENVHPHRFRRTLATELCRHGMPIQEVARILGHDKIDTTLKYVVLNKDDIKTAYRRYAS